MNQAKFKVRQKPFHLELEKHVTITNVLTDDGRDLYEFKNNGVLWWATEEELTWVKGSYRPSKFSSLVTKQNNNLKSITNDDQYLSIRGQFIGTTYDGYRAYEVNQLALDPPRITREQPPRKEKPFTRVTLANISHQDLMLAHNRNKRKNN